MSVTSHIDCTTESMKLNACTTLHHISPPHCFPILLFSWLFSSTLSLILLFSCSPVLFVLLDPLPCSPFSSSLVLLILCVLLFSLFSRFFSISLFYRSPGSLIVRLSLFSHTPCSLCSLLLHSLAVFSFTWFSQFFLFLTLSLLSRSPGSLCSV